MSTQSAKITALETEMTAVKAKLMALEAKLESLAVPASKSTKKAKNPDAPKQEPNWWLKATQHVRGILKPHIAEMNASLAEGDKKIPGTAPVAVTKLLKDQGIISSENWEVAEEDVMTAFATFRKNLSEAGSVASKASKASSKPKFADLSDEEKSSIRSVAAKKAAATRAANKAKKEEEMGKGAEWHASRAAKMTDEVEQEKAAVENEWAGGRKRIVEAHEALLAKKAVTPTPSKADTEVQEITSAPQETFKYKNKNYIKTGNELRTPTGEWVGLWNAASKTIDVMAEEP